MSLIATSSRCFNALEAALEAVKTGNADSSEVMIKSIRQDGVLLQKQASIRCDELKQDEKKQQELDEDLTRQINKLHAEEVELKNRRQGLEAKKSALNEERERCCRNKRDASRRYENAKAEKREAEEKLEEAEKWGWVPGYGTFLVVRELVQNNKEKASDARREMERYDGEMSRAESNIRSANTAISQVGVIFLLRVLLLSKATKHAERNSTIATKRFAIEVCFSIVLRYKGFSVSFFRKF